MVNLRGPTRSTLLTEEPDMTLDLVPVPAAGTPLNMLAAGVTSSQDGPPLMAASAAQPYS